MRPETIPLEPHELQLLTASPERVFAVLCHGGDHLRLSVETFVRKSGGTDDALPHPRLTLG